VPWRGSVRNIILLHTHTTLPQNFSNNFFFSPLTVYTRHFSCIAVANETDQPLLTTIPVYRLTPSFPVYLLRGVIESLYMIFP